MDRLHTALTEYRITMPYDETEILAAVRKLDDLTGGQDGYFRLNVSAGVHDIGLAPSSYASPNVILFRKELAPTVRGTEKKAVWLDTTRNKPESTVRHKSHNFLNNVRGRLELPSLKEIGRSFCDGGRFCCGRRYVKCFLDERRRAIYTSYRNGNSAGDNTCIYH